MTRDELTSVLAPFPEASPLPRAAFLEPEVLQLEERTFLSSNWVPVAHVQDIPRPGDWVRAPVKGQHLILIRDSELTVRAVYPLCPHRGTLLCEGERGQIPRLTFQCPYHGWAFDTFGRVLDAPGSRDAPAGLLVAPLQERAGVLFVTLDSHSRPLAQSWENGPPWLDPAALGPLTRARRQDHEVRANWKIIVGNFQESHHFPLVHPALEEKTPWRSSFSITKSEAWLGGVMPLSPPFETVSLTGRLQGRTLLAARGQEQCVLDAYVFPLWLTSLQPDYLLTYRLSPLAVDLTLVVAEIHVHPASLSKRPSLEDVFQFWDQTNAEDRAICELQQRGLSSRHAPPLTYATSEDGLHAFERIIALNYLRALGMEAQT